ncbi:hypothetical protein ACOME3_003585 [Neoechinorhynchus agilis]
MSLLPKRSNYPLIYYLRIAANHVWTLARVIPMAFEIEGSFYDQRNDVTMESPLVLTLSDIYTRDLESTSLELHSHVNRWWRYVDDVFILADSNHNKDSLNAVLNIQDAHIQWTVNEVNINGGR